MTFVHENNRYTVEAVLHGSAQHPTMIISGDNSYYNYYAVRNRATGVYELYTPDIIQAIAYSENAKRFLDHEPWKWVDQADEQAPVGGLM